MGTERYHWMPTVEDIREAHSRISPFINRTPVMTSFSIDSIAGCSISFKCENLQKVGAFKFRGATNAVLMLSDEQASRGVATHSSGNHAQALALAARNMGIPAHVVMPRNSPRVKVEAVKDYGAEITFCEPTLKAREKTLEQVIERTGAEFIHPYDDARIISGQATAAVELLEEVKDIDIMMTPVGGGGLTSGTALATRYLSPGTTMIAAEPEKADDAYRSFRSKRLIPSTNPETIADGLRTSLSELTFRIILENVNDIVTVSEKSIVYAMKLIWERMKIVVEPSAAVPLAAILERKLDVERRKIGVILSGGNVDLEKLPW